MRQAGLHSRRRPKRRVHTTDNRHHRPVTPNLLKRDFSASTPNEKWGQRAAIAAARVGVVKHIDLTFQHAGNMRDG